MPVYELNGITFIVNRTISEEQNEKLKNALFTHFMNKALSELEEKENDGDKEITRKT